MTIKFNNVTEATSPKPPPLRLRDLKKGEAFVFEADGRDGRPCLVVAGGRLFIVVDVGRFLSLDRWLLAATEDYSSYKVKRVKFHGSLDYEVLDT